MRVHFVVEQLDAVGQGAAHGKQVDQAAAHAEFARRYHLRHMLITGEHQLGAQRLGVQLGALLQKEGVRRQDMPGGRRYSAVEAAINATSQAPRLISYSVASRSEIRS